MELKNIRYFKDNKLHYGDIRLNNYIEEITEYSYSDTNSDILIPAYIDIHCHGGFGYEIMDCNADMLCEFSKKLLTTGTGLYMPTLVGADYDKIERVIEEIALAKEKNRGAKIVGAHIEGTFISKEKSGIINKSYIFPPDTRLIDRLLPYNIKLRFTIAPETENAMEFIEYATQKGCYISLGHSCCSSQTALTAIQKGATSITHLFNAMLPLEHREPNLVGIGLTEDIYCEVICDTYHIDKRILKLIYNAKGIDKGIIVSDSMCAMGLNDGRYNFCNKEIFVKDGKATDINGTLAGSICNMHTGVLNMMRVTGKSLEEILPWAITNPAKAINIKNHSINIGNNPDMLLLDKDYHIKQVITF